jgi:hypothetical protein
MKPVRKTTLTLVVCLIACCSAFSQQTGSPKPALFASYPSNLAISELSLQNILSLQRDQELTLQFGNGFNFPCRVLRTDANNANVKTVIVRSSAFDNALMQLSMFTDENGLINYTGRIMNVRSADGYMLQKTSSGTYELKKFETDSVLETCAQ